MMNNVELGYEKTDVLRVVKWWIIKWDIYNREYLREW